jgi:hypothetical protein
VRRHSLCPSSSAITYRHMRHCTRFLSATDQSLLLVCLQDALGDTENGDSVSVNFFGDGTANNGAHSQAVRSFAPPACQGQLCPLLCFPDYRENVSTCNDNSICQIRLQASAAFV